MGWKTTPASSHLSSVSPGALLNQSGAFDGSLPKMVELTVGMRVEARYGEGDDFFPGTVETMNDDGTCNIEYDDGDAESNKPRRSLRLKGETVQRPLEVGQVVDCACEHMESQVIEGTILAIDKPNYRIEFALKDGETVVETCTRDFIFGDWCTPP